jgi:hypothetical protein
MAIYREITDRHRISFIKVDCYKKVSSLSLKTMLRTATEDWRIILKEGPVVIGPDSIGWKDMGIGTDKG